ncbi:MAG: hypothetical protein DHS20C12_05250 [Pseudohongiella sp.]|nr:MAG: hypothetical protein DHS20C12_05250 [Pseudohongiella sp.]
MLKQLTPVNIIVAHGLEAKALVPMLGLERQQTPSGFAEYCNSDNLCLLVSGIGKEAMAAAVNYLGDKQAVGDGEMRAWLNIGIAGHTNAPLGSAWLGNKITDFSSARSAYPPQLFDGFEVGSVVTVEEPESVYPLDAAYEMEAAAFYAAASTYSTAEMVQVYKIISDNLEHPLSRMDIKIVPELIAGHADKVKLLIQKMSKLLNQHNVSQSLPSAYLDLCAKLRLTVNQRLQLKRLCQRYRALDLETELERVAGLKPVDAKQLLAQLSRRIDEDQVSVKTLCSRQSM